MASVEEPPDLSLRHGLRCVPEDGVMVEDILFKVGQKVNLEHIVSASQIIKALVVFLKEQNLVNQLLVSGFVINNR